MAKSWFDWLKRGKRHDAARGFMARLRADTRGNTLAIMAAAVIPMIGMVGGGIDLSRMYIVKTRLQHACDAGALAGRKAMGSGTWAQSSYAPRARAQEFFDANFKPDSYGSTDTDKEFTENAGTVRGRAWATVPMTLMRVLGRTTEDINVTCEAEMRLPNTDIMFVLDTTGSMAYPQPGDSVNKIEALKTSVKCFYEILARLDTDANCSTGAPSGGTGSQVQIRFGFVPFATNVNVGRLLKPEWVADTWPYQSREYLLNAPGFTPWYNVGWVRCRDVPGNSATVQYRSVSTSGSSCYAQRRDASLSVAYWHYGKISQPISGLKNGSGWNNSFQLRIGNGGSMKTIAWDGCVEERDTERAASYTPIPPGAKDLDIDSTPSGSGTKWGAVLPGMIYTRNIDAASGTGSWSTDEIASTTEEFGNESYYACPRPARKLQPWPDADAFDTYVDALTPSGNTYHDIGLLWGARLTSPTGLFANENALTPQGGEIDRHIIFMTDGDACTAPDNYTAYGVSWFDRRQTDPSAVPTGGCTETGTLTQQVNARTEALCAAVRNKNITLWVIAFGDNASISPTIQTRLQNCASPGRYFLATSAATLQQTFKSIAEQISALRLTQ